MICITAEYVQRIHVRLTDRMTSVPEEPARATLTFIFSPASAKLVSVSDIW